MIIPGIFAQRQRAVTIYLNNLSVAPRVAYSLKKVISTANKAVRVRRSSDNTELDIGFVGDAFDVTSLLAFAGAGSAFVKVFYDQTPTGINMVQSTASDQPRIVNAGVFDGAAIFDGVNDWMSAAAVPFGSGYAAIYAKVAIPNIGMILESSSNYNYYFGSFVWYMENNLQSLGVNGGYPWRRDYSIPSSSNLRTISSRYQMAVSDSSIAQHRFRDSGTDISPFGPYGTAAAAAGTNFTTQTLFLGSRAGNAFFGAVKIHTLVIYAVNTDAEVAAIESIIDM